jgi:NAD(P)-dependent dehydrogenase (short-subunit alcohol dehydrogenase family)
LSSVHEFASWYNNHYTNLDILITNAGINYRSNNLKPTPETPLISPQGYDLTFATNYLGHFLLIELLLPSLLATPNSRVILISSGSHYFINGINLIPNPIPYAALVSHHLDTTHWEEAYPTSKLAQILQMFALQDRIDDLPLPFTVTSKHRRLQVLSTQPGFTLTPMVPSLLITFLGRLMYTPEAASMSTLWALFDLSISGRSFLSNTPNFWYNNQFGIILRTFLVGCGLKSVFLPLALPINLILQNIFYGKIINDPPNPVVREEPELVRLFYQWSQNEIKSYLIDQTSSVDQQLQQVATIEN